ncbi:hypothetical protein CDAR_412302 [Caerostris darwini]|uniref:Uncharacterized protein n=1 Tax=Caerostris darwini TaxID=1538125 RepID=A0AAV4NX29_9ARAC|nr:hypothetical protein CDAR_412301 [Caerostris darwini]GIX87613.1 hypothetical protein CDAR_412302 [Caerostris darwini]
MRFKVVSVFTIKAVEIPAQDTRHSQCSVLISLATMKAAYLFFLIVAICAMVSQAAVHHYKVENDDGHKKHGGGSIFDTAASVINGII